MISARKVDQIKLVILHNGRASFSILSRKYQCKPRSVTKNKWGQTPFVW